MPGRLGEAEGIKKLFEAVMDLSLVDPRIKPFFRIPHIQMVRENIGKYLVGLLGGPQTYEGKGLFEVHEHLGEQNVKDFSLRSAKNCVQVSMIIIWTPSYIISTRRWSREVAREP